MLDPPLPMLDAERLLLCTGKPMLRSELRMLDPKAPNV